MPDDLDPSERFPAGLSTDGALAYLYTELHAIKEALMAGGRLTVAAEDKAAFDRQLAEAENEAARAEAEAEAQAAAAASARERIVALRNQRSTEPVPDTSVAPIGPFDVPGPLDVPTSPFGRSLLGP